jgi:hypothetical protein
MVEGGDGEEDDESDDSESEDDRRGNMSLDGLFLSADFRGH